MKNILSTLLFTLFCFVSYAQQGSLKLRIVDHSTKEGIAGAVVVVTSTKNPEAKKYVTSGYRGQTKIEGVQYGTYTLEATFLGYEPTVKQFKMGSAKMDLGDIALKEGVQIETVVKEVKALRTSQKGDTVSYNAGAFKVSKDADVEGLLKKMPGLTISNGSVEAQGEQVKKIFVDGKEFFGDDVTTAIKTLPAESVDRIEVFNKLSDAAEFSGMDDGEGFKALNIVTLSHMRNGKFGKIFAGVGYDADTHTEDEFKYTAGGNVNIFKQDTRLSVIGLFNNVNQQNFSFEDILGVSGGNRGGGHPHGKGGAGEFMMPQQSGVAKVNALGVNFSDAWGKRKNVTFEGSYFFNNNVTTNLSTVDKWYEAPMYQNDTLHTQGYSRTRGYNHRFSGRLEWKISENQSLMIRPKFSYQSNDPISWTKGWQYGAPSMGGSGYSRTDHYNDALRHGYNVGANVVYRAKLGKAGRTLTLDGFGRYADNDNEANNRSNLIGRQPIRPSVDPETGLWNPDAGWIDPDTGEEHPYTHYRYQHATSPTSKYSLRGQVTYTEPMSANWMFSLQYRVSYDDEQRDKRAYLTGEDYSTDGLSPDPMLSNSYASNYTRQSIGPGIRYVKNRSMFIANVNYQNSVLKGDGINQRTTGNPAIDKQFDHVTYFIMARLNINPENSLRLFISSYTSKPSIGDLQNIYDVSSSQNITHGNPDLDPAYRHTIRFHYTNSNVEKGRTFMWTLYFQTMVDYNATHLVQNPGQITIDGKTYNPNYYSTPVNLSGYRMLRTQLSYGFPIGFLKSNFNLMAGLTYSREPSILGGEVQADGTIRGGERNDTQNMGYDACAVLGSNISEKVDFTLQWEGRYNEATNKFQGDAIKNRYFNHQAKASMKFVLPLDFTLTASYLYQQYLGFTNDYDDSYMLCNLWIGKKIFKSRRGEILIGVNDVFNQNKAFERSTGSGWTQNALNSVIGRYYMIQFNYNLRKFGKNGSQKMEEYGFGGDRRKGQFPRHGSGYGKGHYQGMF